MNAQAAREMAHVRGVAHAHRISRGEALDVAAAIAARIVAKAQWRRDVCGWEVRAPDAAALCLRSEPAGGALYQGTAGIGLFLGEFAARTGDRSARACAVGALSAACELAERLPPRASGLYTGRTGIAYASAAVGTALGEEPLLDRARQTLAAAGGPRPLANAWDATSGAAGAIPALLQLAVWLNDDRLRVAAINFGEYLISIAKRGALGWSWPSSSASARDLTGFAHGASGAAHALIELYAATGDSRFRSAAVHAFTYERACFDAEAGNWPDYRFPALAELRQQQRAAKPVSYAPGFRIAWCHGAPGIGLARLHAFEVLGGDEQCRVEAEVALATTREALFSQSSRMYSLCHGACGNAEMLLHAARVFGVDDLAGEVRQMAAQAAETHEGGGQPWRCNVYDEDSDPSLMMGEAGIGYFYLGLADPNLRSILLITADRHSPRPPAPLPTTLTIDYVRHYFSRTLDLVALIGHEPSVRPDIRDDDALKAAERLIQDRRVHVTDARSRAMLDDCFALERSRYLLGLDCPLRADDRLGSASANHATGATGRIALSPTVRLVNTAWDWDRVSGVDSIEQISEMNCVYVLHAKDGLAHLDRLTVRAASVLACLEGESTFDEIVDRVRQAAIDEESRSWDRAAWSQLCASELRRASAVGWLTISLADA